MPESNTAHAHTDAMHRTPSRSPRRGVGAALRDAWTAATDLIFPRTCGACRAPLLERRAELCATCGEQLALVVGGDYCRVCGGQVGPHLLRDGRCTDCAGRRPKIERFVRVGLYREPLRTLVVSFKHEAYLDRFLGGLLGDLLIAELPDVDLLVPIPSPLIRRWKRTYAPTELLARVAARRTHRPWSPALEMARRVRRQTGLSREAREANVSGAFRAVPGREPEGRHVCLIDDVSTTGATLRDAARACRAAGAARVSAAVLAKATLK